MTEEIRNPPPVTRNFHFDLIINKANFPPTIAEVVVEDKLLSNQKKLRDVDCKNKNKIVLERMKQREEGNKKTFL